MIAGSLNQAKAKTLCPACGAPFVADREGNMPCPACNAPLRLEVYELPQWCRDAKPERGRRKT